MHLIVGNWKMNPQTTAEARRIVVAMKRLAHQIKNSKMVVAPPHVYTSLALNKSPLRTYSVGAQDVSLDESGSRTGEVGASMLRDVGVSYVVIGHSERREYKGETNDTVALKARRAIDAGMTAVVCIGEKVRNEDGSHLVTLREDIHKSLATIVVKDLDRIVIAYEPVWAIGVKEAMSPHVVNEMRLFIKKTLSDMYGQKEAEDIPILYGGSVNARNAREIVQEGKVSGLLVGRESINPSGFAEMVKSLEDIK